MEIRQLGFYMGRIMRMRRWLTDQKLAADKQEVLYYGQLPILEYIKANPGCLQKAVAERFSLSKASVTKSIRRMLENELLSRTVNPEEKRQQLLFITEKGIELTEVCRQAFDEVDAQMFKDFSEEEMEELMRLYEKMIDNMSSDYNRKN